MQDMYILLTPAIVASRRLEDHFQNVFESKSEEVWVHTGEGKQNNSLSLLQYGQHHGTQSFYF